MQRDFQITGGIYLAQPPHELDLHNNFKFCGLQYSVENRTLLLRWRRSTGEWVVTGTPASATIEFREVSEFRFPPRDAQLPFTEDDCLHEFGYWTDEDWAKDQIILQGSQAADPNWLTAIGFMSGAIIIVQAASAQAFIEP